MVIPPPFSLSDRSSVTKSLFPLVLYLGLTYRLSRFILSKAMLGLKLQVSRGGFCSEG